MDMMNIITWSNYEHASRTESILHITVVTATYPHEKEQVTLSLTITFWYDKSGHVPAPKNIYIIVI